ncbi:hypothetical protein OEZ86_004320 [Tetradesmus obliquus]|nr:hypothetical protein OEZ86_004320 [Tetradesmus obliquus]
MWKGCGRQCPRCGKTEDFDLLIIPENRQLALACINHCCCSACARAFYDKSNADRSQFHMGFHRLCPVCSGSFQLRLPVKGENLQILFNGANHLPYKCPACSQNSRSNAGPSSSSQVLPATPEKQVPQVPVTIEKGPTAADTSTSESVYHAHSSGPGVPGGLKFHQYVRQAAATAHSSQGTSSNPINVSDCEDLSQLLSDPVVVASIDKVTDAFYKAHPEVAAQLAARTHSNAAAAADQVLPPSAEAGKTTPEKLPPPAKAAKTAPEASPACVAAAAAAAAVSEIDQLLQNELAADVPTGSGAAAGDVTSDSPAK